MQTMQELGARKSCQQPVSETVRPQPEICWADGLRPLLQLLAVAFESGLVWQQCDQSLGMISVIRGQ